MPVQTLCDDDSECEETEYCVGAKGQDTDSRFDDEFGECTVRPEYEDDDLFPGAGIPGGGKVGGCSFGMIALFVLTIAGYVAICLANRTPKARVEIVDLEMIETVNPVTSVHGA